MVKSSKSQFVLDQYGENVTIPVILNVEPGYQGQEQVALGKKKKKALHEFFLQSTGF
jgi:hypothetical protein